MDRDTIKRVEREALEAVDAASSLHELERVKGHYLGRKGVVTAFFAAMKDVSPQDKPEIGRLLNALKKNLQEAVRRRMEEVKGGEGGRRVVTDVTFPGRRVPLGRVHPVNAALEEICGIFHGLGFSVAEGPEVEDVYHNFEALNMPCDHPSRDAFDTLWISSDLLMRSHTSTVQIRYMEAHEPPVRIVAPGRVYRPDTVDASHHFMFHQVEGLAVEEGITFADLKYVLKVFAERFFGRDLKTRFRPSFFPFTEPSAEMDISCLLCEGEGCAVCKGSGWVEVLGCGMVDVNVFESVGYDAERYTGFAFGMGVERLVMLRCRIDDIRMFTDNNVVFLEQMG